MDHIEGGGTRARLKTEPLKRHIYHWLKKNDYPDGFQVLCMNCQFIKRIENNEWGHKAVQEKLFPQVT
jgi:hypothetical protein